MAVSSLRTSIVSFATAPTFVNYGGGAGAGLNTDIYIEGTQSAGRRSDNVADHGFGVSFAAVNLSAAEQHIKIWLWITHWSVTTQVQFRISDGVNDDDHNLPTSEFPELGGWLPAWVDVSRTPEVGGSTNEASVTEIGTLIDIGDVGGNAPNIVLDEITYGTSGLRWDGTSGSFSDFVTFEGANAEGVLITISGVYFCYARLEIGSSTATTFTDSSFQLVFPNQSLVSTAFMGISIDLQNASTSVSWTSAVIKSSGTKQGDIIATSTAGDFTATGTTFDNIRAITLTSGCTLDTCTIQNSGQITQASSVITDCRIAESTASAAIASNNPANISGCSFVSSGTGHAIEITTAGTYSFVGNSFSGYAGTNGSTGNEAIYNNSGGAVTLNISGGGGTPSIRNGSGASTTVNNNISVTLTGLKDSTEIRVYSTGTSTELAGTEDATTGTLNNRSFTFSLSAGTLVDIRIHNVQYEAQSILNYQVPTSDSSVPIQQRFDRNYSNT